MTHTRATNDDAPRGLVVVTGASSGIGAAIVQRLAREGYDVTGVSRRPAPQIANWVAADLGDAEAARSVAARVSGPIYGIVHAAGHQIAEPLGALDPGSMDSMWQVHVASAAALVDALSDRLMPGGRIVLLGSRTMTGAAGKSQYAATKAALPAMARSWAAELAPRRVTVNVVAPGPTDTPMLADPRRAGVAPLTPPLGRLVEPAEVAGLVAFLIGSPGAMITGQTLVICGGTSLPGVDR